jgi:hypothetical protein
LTATRLRGRRALCLLANAQIFLKHSVGVASADPGLISPGLPARVFDRFGVLIIKVFGCVGRPTGYGVEALSPGDIPFLQLCLGCIRPHRLSLNLEPRIGAQSRAKFYIGILLSVTASLNNT